MPIETVIVLAFVVGAFVLFIATLAYAERQTRDLARHLRHPERKGVVSGAGDKLQEAA